MNRFSVRCKSAGRDPTTKRPTLPNATKPKAWRMPDESRKVVTWIKTRVIIDRNRSHCSPRELFR
ncbi:hypothetical protein PHLCEN_2v1292 [Hermanssonia centrifuga]|uniref:Uncharacterized protein n=1 Tax=Hermanssonia centrifuga TaxID=98765 RepID=A0A2R6S3K1_9APHY|nr:hypothetical protein PHLCEN_2v1292 [Hermanssonia centrifuga]